MQVVVAATTTPFARGGALLLAQWLTIELRARGHEADLCLLPFHSSVPGILHQTLALRSFDLQNRGDRLIAIRTPAYVLRHHQKVTWFIHHHRGAYDLWGGPYGDLPDTPIGRGYRDALRSVDDVTLRESRRLFANSQTTASRLQRFNSLPSEILYPPLHQPERFHSTGYGDAIVSLSRVTDLKRQSLLIEALAGTSTGVRLIVAGSSETPEGFRELERKAEQLGVSRRVDFVPGWFSEERKAELLADALAVALTPFDEDSYSFAALEAQHACKAVLTTTDAGGLTELIAHERNGLVAAPSAAALAREMDRLYRDRPLAKSLGQQGPKRIEELGIDWDHAIGRLLA